MPHVKVRADHMSTKTDVDTVPIRLMGEDHKQSHKNKQFCVTKNMVHDHGLTPGCPACQKMGQKEKTRQGHNKRCHHRMFEEIVRKVGLRKAKKMKINNTDWEARIRIAEEHLKTSKKM